MNAPGELPGDRRQPEPDVRTALSVEQKSDLEGSRQSMSKAAAWLLAALIVAAAALATGLELRWRIDHVRDGTPSATVGGVVFESYLLPERSVVPYGVGVFARAWWNPLRSVGTSLVFAAYCGKELALRADGENAVEIVCAPKEGSPRLLADRHGGVQIRPRAVPG